MVTVSNIYVGFTLDKTEIAAVCVVYLEKAFDRVPRNELEWEMRKKGMLEVLVSSVVSLCEGAKRRV